MKKIKTYSAVICSLLCLSPFSICTTSCNSKNDKITASLSSDKSLNTTPDLSGVAIIKFTLSRNLQTNEYLTLQFTSSNITVARQEVNNDIACFYIKPSKTLTDYEPLKLSFDANLYLSSETSTNIKHLGTFEGFSYNYTPYSKNSITYAGTSRALYTDKNVNQYTIYFNLDREIRSNEHLTCSVETTETAPDRQIEKYVQQIEGKVVKVCVRLKSISPATYNSIEDVQFKLKFMYGVGAINLWTKYEEFTYTYVTDTSKNTIALGCSKELSTAKVGPDQQTNKSVTFVFSLEREMKNGETIQCNVLGDVSKTNCVVSQKQVNVEVELINIEDIYENKYGNIAKIQFDYYDAEGNILWSKDFNDLTVNYNSKRISNETNEEYIRNRTISMIERNENDDIVVGTGWILADATPEVADDFVYYVATNMHVAMGFEEFDGVFKYGTWACREAIKNKYMDEYFQEKGIWVLDGLENKNYFDGEELEWNNYAAFEGIDLYVQKMNLNNFQNDSKDVSIAKGLGAQFDKLNNIQQQFGKINQFEAIENVNVEKFYVGGFPTHNYFEHWQFNEIDAGNIAYYEAGEVVHNIGNSELVDNAPQLIIQEPVALDWLGPGASGSMLIDEYNQVVGIYWGGFGAEEEGYFYPAFSVLDKTRIQSYI